MNGINLDKLNKTSINYLEEDIEKLLYQSEIREDKPIKQNSVLLEIKEKHNIPIFTLGNFSAFKGKAKSRKTFATTLFIAQCVYDFDSIMICNQRGNVLLFDTEQSEYHLFKTIQRVSGIVLNDFQASNFFGFCLRPYMPDLRVKIIEHCLYNLKDITYVVIDGVRDLLFDINDQKEAVIITTKLMQWTKELNCHISVVIHENKSDGNARGHIGSEIQNKCETVLKVEKDEENSIIIPEYTRGQDFNPISFKIEKTDKCFIPVINQKTIPF